MRQRPTHRELTKKIAEAKAALSNQEGLFADPSKTVPELTALNIGDTEEVWPLIQELLEEIDPSHYTGGRPPLKSYEKAIEGKELFAFSWDSQKLSRRMYLKFALKDKRFYYVSLHKDHPPSGNKNGGKP